MKSVTLRVAMETTMKSVMVRVALLGLLLGCVTMAPTTKQDWEIYSFHINSTVTSRYATTVITSRVANRVDTPKEIEFHVQIPKNAFISKFRMMIKKETYDGVVKEKEVAAKQYADAVSRGQSAGLVSSVGRTLEEFKTAVTVAAHEKVTFELTYEELLRRRLGKYELLIHARPMQPVADFKVDVYINEKPGINFLEINGGLSKTLANSITSSLDNDQARVQFYPTLDRQKSCGDGCGEDGLNGDLVVVYDVNRNDSLGDVVESDGYFLHHFAPKDLPRIPKNVVFLIDRSGSMHGSKMQQTRDAMVKILGDLAEDDFFGLVTFDSELSTWRTELVPASISNLNAAKDFTRGIQDRGATDINAAVLLGAQLLNKHPREGSASLLILLTDGDPTTGVTNLGTIQSNVRESVGQRFPLYCLGFGFDVNFEFLSSLALENSGSARRIYPDSDAAQQLQGFYEEVATPLLTDVQMIYIGASNLTQTNFSQYYNGSEIVVAGQIIDNNIESFTTQVIGISKSQKMEFGDKKSTLQAMDPTTNSSASRVWAYLTLKQLLDREVQYSGVEKEKAKATALHLALQYGFVTPHTSMVVTKPEGDDTHVAHKPKEGEKPQRHHHHHHHQPSVFQSVSFQSRGRGPAGMSPVTGSLGGGYRLSGGGSGLAGGYGLPPPPPPPAVGLPMLPVGSAADDYGYGGVGQSPPMYNYRDYSAWLPTMTTTTTRRTTTTTTTVPPAPGPAPDQTAMDLDSVLVIVSTLSFLLPAEGSAQPLCVELPIVPQIKILDDPDNECTIKGQPGKAHDTGFKKIVINYKTVELTLEVDSLEIYDGQRRTQYSWSHNTRFTNFTNNRMAVIMRDKEMDVTIGDCKIVILINSRNEMWPVLKQRPSGNISGLIAGKPVVYEEIQGASSPTLKINDQEVIVSRSSAMDFRVPGSAGPVPCWLLPVQAAQQSGLLSSSL